MKAEVRIKYRQGIGLCLLLSSFCLLLAGCAVRDGHEDEPAPIWWPTFLYRPTTHPTDEEYNQTDATLNSPWMNAAQAGDVFVG